MFTVSQTTFHIYGSLLVCLTWCLHSETQLNTYTGGPIHFKWVLENKEQQRVQRQAGGRNISVTCRQQKVDLSSTLCKWAAIWSNNGQLKGSCAHFLFIHFLKLFITLFLSRRPYQFKIRKTHCSQRHFPWRIQCVPAYLQRHQSKEYIMKGGIPGQRDPQWAFLRGIATSWWIFKGNIGT